MRYVLCIMNAFSLCTIVVPNQNPCITIYKMYALLAYVLWANQLYLIQAREALHRGSMVLEEGVRRALGLFMGEHRRAYRCRLRGLNYPDIDPNSYQEVAGNNQMPSGPPIVMCWLGLAWKPWLWPGFRWPVAWKSQAKAKVLGLGLAWPGFGPGHGLLVMIYIIYYILYIIYYILYIIYYILYII